MEPRPYIKTRTRTVLRQINKDEPVTVTSPCFRFINTGTVTVFINGFPLQPLASWGDNSDVHFSSMLQYNRGKVQNYREDIFDIVFKFGSGTGQGQQSKPEGTQQQQSPSERQSVYLVQTFYDIIT